MIEKTKGFNFKYVGVVGLVLLGLLAAPFFVDGSKTNTEVDQAIIQPVPPVQVTQDIQPVQKAPEIVAPVVALTQQRDPKPIQEIVEIAPAAGSEKPELETDNTDKDADALVDEDPNKVDYNSVLSFPITEEKIKAFVIAADKIDQVNRKWDMLISGAETDTMAVEYITLSSEEMANIMGSISEITVDQYNEIFDYTIKNQDFKNIVNAFKQYYLIAPPFKEDQVLSSETSAN